MCGASDGVFYLKRVALVGASSLATGPLYFQGGLCIFCLRLPVSGPSETSPENEGQVCPV